MRTTSKKMPLLIIVLILILTIAGCESKTDTAGSSSDDTQEILITGLLDTDYKITVGELKKLPAVTEKARATRANGETVKVKATGPLLEEVLQQQGKSVKDYSNIRFNAQDGYSIAVPADILKNRSIILAYQIDGKALDVENQPVYVVIPDERSMYWVRMMDRIELSTGAEQTPIKKVVFLETAVKTLPQEDYEYFESIDQAVKTKDLVDTYAGTDKAKSVFIKGSDGLTKNETESNFLSAYIKITGKEAPKFLAPHLPQGMHVQDILCINYGGTSFMVYSQGTKVIKQATVDGQSGIALSDIIKQTGLSRAEKYKFSSLQGQSLELSVEELGSGLIYENGKESLVFCYPGAGEKSVDNFLSIECVK